MEITIKVKNIAETGIAFTLYVDGKENTSASVGEFEKKHITVCVI
jgi:hypothetical protein